jgi:transposase-like protein
MLLSVECAPGAGQIALSDLTVHAGLPGDGSHGRTYSVAFKRQVAQEYLAGESLHGLAKRHDLARNLIRIWVVKYEAGAFDDDAQAADLLQE